ncbi:hypothetical protein F4778DRAFT_177671 [Xylariomycetidae sp. FL2044]|nr:hypothetical protein F4778DRAFT_177671 [Xylariomycetidae sp. FL2044]
MSLDKPKDSGVSLTPFFDRCKLPAGAQSLCDEFVRSTYAESVVRPAPFQGYCSYTVLVDDSLVVQFRPAAHELDTDMTRAASEVFGALAPDTEYLGELGDTGLRICSMTRIPGVALSDLRAGGDVNRHRHRLRSRSRIQRERIVRDFAGLQAMSWRHAREKTSGAVIVRKKLVGSSLRWRLELMASSLPSRFRPIARSLLCDLPDIETTLPWTLSHGDFLPANVMADPESGAIRGLLDWAEAEFLPFGVGMYGLEELLGEERDDGHFAYYPEANRLRRLFWTELLLRVPELARRDGGRRLALVQKAQRVGILLWHGIAFDDGALNRAVQEGVDDAEVERLDAFLLSSPGSRPRGARMFRRVLGTCFAPLRGLLFEKRNA